MSLVYEEDPELLDLAATYTGREYQRPPGMAPPRRASEAREAARIRGEGPDARKVAEIVARHSGEHQRDGGKMFGGSP